MELLSLKASTRAGGSKGAARQARAKRLLPAVLYGGAQEPVPLTLDLHQFELLIYGRSGEHAVVRIEIEDNPKFDTPALLKAVQRHPARGNILHADFLRIRLDERIETVVPVRAIGHPVGVVEGGVLDQSLREVEVECLALEVPEEITIEITDLHIGDSIHVEQLAPPENVKILTDPDRPIVAVHTPRALKEAAPEEEAEVAEEEKEEAGPEVISERKGKEEEEEK